jgi:hypothetical protein
MRVFARVVIDLGVRPARPRVAHLPEIVLLAETKDALARHAGLDPQLHRLVISLVNSEPEAFERNPIQV